MVAKPERLALGSVRAGPGVILNDCTLKGTSQKEILKSPGTNFKNKPKATRKALSPL